VKAIRIFLPLAATLLFGACRGLTGLDDLSFSAETSPGSTSASSSSGGGVCDPGLTEACDAQYSGPPGTAGVGICRAPSRICDAEGAAFGPCEGEVLPQVEDCGTQDVDESCDGKAACDGTGLWARAYGEAANVDVCGVAVDPAGNLFLAGTFKGGTVDLGGAPLTSSTYRALFIVKLDPEGGHVWSRAVKGSMEQECEGLDVDGEGNVLVAGYYIDGALDFGGGPLPAAVGSDAYYAKLNGVDGQPVWTMAVGGAGDQSGRGIAADGQGGVYLLGRFQNTIQLGVYSLTAKVQNETFAAMLTPDGKVVVAQQYSASGYLHGVAIAAGKATNDMAFAGQIGGMGTFGDTALTGSTTNYDSFIVWQKAFASMVWARGIVGANLQRVGALAFDGAGGLLAAGQFQSTVDFGGIQMTATGDDGFVVRYDETGSATWATAFGGTSEQDVGSVAVDGAGFVLATGKFSGELIVGDKKALNAGQIDLFVAKLHPATGDVIWLRTFGGILDETAGAVAGDSLGNSVVMGKFTGNLDFGGPKGSLLSSEGDAYIVKLAP
jgi:hypothetical protein